MTRVRGFTQDDAHLFCTQEQVQQEILGCLSLVKTVLTTLGMSDYRVRVGLRDPDGKKFAGDPAQWDVAGRAIELLSQQEPDSQALGELLILITTGNDTFFPNRSAYNAMTTGGHLSALPDNDLRLQITNLFERHLVRQEINANFYDSIGFDFMLDIRDPHWDSMGMHLIGDDPDSYVIMRNGVRTLSEQGEFYLALIRETVRTEYVKTLAMIDEYQQLRNE
jgi:hypothetical protein